MKELRLLAIIVCVLQRLDFIETNCTHPFGTGTYISSTRGTWITTNTTIANYKFTIGTLTTTVTLTCYNQSDTNRYIFYHYYQVFNNIWLYLYTCLDIRYSTSDKYYFYEATEFDTNKGDYFTADSTNVCNRANYLTAFETRVVIKQGAYDMNKIYCPNIILGNYTYNTTDDYSDMNSCNNKQQLTFKKNKAKYVALSSGGNLTCMYSETGTYVYLITFNNDISVDNSNTYQFSCFVFSFSGYGSVVYASQRPKSCSSFQTPTSPDSTVGKTFIFTPYVTCQTSTKSKATEDLGWVTGLVAIIVMIIITVIVIACFIFKKDKVSDNEPIIKQEEGQDGTLTPSPSPSLDRGMTQFDLQIETPSVQSFKGQDDKVEDKNVGGEEPLLEEDEGINRVSGEPLPENKEVINSICRDTLPEEKEVTKMRGIEHILEDGDEKLKEDIEVKSITGDEIPQDNILEPGKRINEEVEEEDIPDAEDLSEESEDDFIITQSRIEESEKEKTKSFEEDKDHDDKGDTVEKDFKTTKEVIMQEEDLTMNQDDTLGIFGLDGPLPPGYTSDKDENIIRSRGSRGTPLKNVGWEDKSDIIGSYVDEYSGRRGKENLALAQELLRQRLAQPVKVHHGKEKMQPRCNASDTNIYFLSRNITEEEEKEKNQSLSPQEGRVPLARANSVGSAERERRVNRRTLTVPTHAVVHTHGLAQSGRGFLLNRADFWHERNPVPLQPFHSELSMCMSRMQTIYTIADSGHATMSSPTNG